MDSFDAEAEKVLKRLGTNDAYYRRACLDVSAKGEHFCLALGAYFRRFYSRL
jgi:hypothetical protein